MKFGAVGVLIARNFSSHIKHVPHVCIVGSGPAGFYTAQKILKSHPTIRVDIYEKLPVPFGLVRYGVAPDHPEVKNCINAFTEAAQNERVSFLGNISIGTDVTLNQLKLAYNAVVLAYGSAKDKLLNIPGENISNVLSARQFVGWYNGLPEDANLKLNLDVEDVAVIGHGNVAIDVTRILITPINILKKTDIPEAVLETLSKSRIKNVKLIGRRGAEHVAFTIKELRELINLEKTRPLMIKSDFHHLPPLIPEFPRPKKRLLELLSNTALNPTEEQMAKWGKAEKEWQLHFRLSPLEFISSPDGSIKKIKFIKNRIENDRAIPTEDICYLDCQMVLRSIGYTSIPVDPSIPFDEKKGIIPNQHGKVIGQEGLYVSGWLGTGPVGVLLSTMQSGFTTGKLVVEDINSKDNIPVKNGKEEILKILKNKGIDYVSFSDWNQLDKHEIKEGNLLGKPREKITDLQKMLRIIHRES